VLDECDKLTDKNSIGHVDFILKSIPRDKQTLQFSATVKGEDVRREVPQSITHSLIVCDRRDKYAALRGLVHNDKITKALLFVNNTGEAEHAAERLSHHGIKAAALSASLSGAERKTAINKLRNGGVVVLAATDAAARGLDIQGLTHVINMEPPQTADEYLHRAGRTGRMGAVGTVVTLASEGEKAGFDRIMKVLKIKYDTMD
jgi:superfamily II DNA/RNA helicase